MHQKKLPDTHLTKLRLAKTQGTVVKRKRVDIKPPILKGSGGGNFFWSLTVAKRGGFRCRPKNKHLYPFCDIYTKYNVR